MQSYTKIRSARRYIKNMGKRKLAFTVILGITIGSAFAQSTVELASDGNKQNNRTNFDQRYYGGIGLGTSDLAPESTSDFLRVEDGNDTAFKLFLGIDLARRLTAEAFVSDLGSAELSFRGDKIDDVGYQIGGISLLGYLFGTHLGSAENLPSALDSRSGLSGFLRIGLGIMENESDINYDRDHKVHVHAGLGLEYGWTNGLAVRAEVTGYDTDAAYAGFSVLKRFGKNRDASQYGAIADPVVETPTEEVIEQVLPELLGTTAYFEFARAELTPQASAKLNQVAKALLVDKERAIKIEGHTDEIDTKEFNMMLSLKRAAAVKNYLLDKGVDTMQMSMTGFGESRPVADNRDEEGRRLNRRVELIVR